MDELNMKQPAPVMGSPKPELPAHHVSKSLKVLMLVFAVLLVAGLGYLVWFQNATTETTEETTVTPKKTTGTTSTTTTTTADETVDWKTFSSTALGISFKYPSTWTTPVLTHNTTAVNSLVQDSYATWTTAGPSKMDTAGIFSIASYGTTHKPFGGKVPNAKSISTAWTKAQFISEMGYTTTDGLEVLIYKKVGSISSLLANYGNLECSEALSLSVITPLSGATYKNLQINIGYDFSTDPAVKASTGTNGDVCNKLDVYKTLATKIDAGTYSTTVADYINTAKLIADSVKTL